jgi:hypothetical protein
MKTLKILFLSILLLVIVFSQSSCENLFNNDSKDEYKWVVNLDDEQKMIRKSVEDIEFTFSLLNEDGDTTNVFNEGENFFFYFSMKNNRGEKMYTLDMPVPGDDFCKVYNSDNKYIGKPYDVKGAQHTSLGHPFPDSSIIESKFPWTYDKELWDSIYSKMTEETPGFLYKGLFIETTYQEPLSKGKYYTMFSHGFEFSSTDDKADLLTEELTFKINFEIQ